MQLIKTQISLLHASYFRENGPEPVREAWLGSATHPERVEYLVAVTKTDHVALEQTAGVNRIIVAPPDGRSSAVKNWNSLARLAIGGMLFVIADDLFPCEEGWDSRLEEIAQKYDPRRLAYVVKVTDSKTENDTKLRHPVVSRRYYKRYGLWNPLYSGMYVDTDLTLSAFWKSTIVDGRHIQFNHLNPVVDDKVPSSISFREANTAREYALGRTTLDARWPRQLQQTRVKLVSPTERYLLVASLRLRMIEAFSLILRSRLLHWLRMPWLALRRPPDFQD